MLEADKRGRICSKEKALELIKSDKSAVDLAVLQIKGKIYLVENDIDQLLARYRKDFPEHAKLHAK